MSNHDVITVATATHRAWHVRAWWRDANTVREAAIHAAFPIGWGVEKVIEDATTCMNVPFIGRFRVTAELV